MPVNNTLGLPERTGPCTAMYVLVQLSLVSPGRQPVDMDKPNHPLSIATGARRQRRARCLLALVLIAVTLLATAVVIHLLQDSWLHIAPGDWLGID